MRLPFRVHGLILFTLSFGAYACSGVPELLLNDDDKPSNTGGRNGSGGGDIPIPIGGSGNASTGGDSGDDAVCGNGVLEIGELCDDGGTKSGDGCSKDCADQDPDYDCSVPGEPCKDLVVCGNGILEGDEVCDEGAFATSACQDECTKVAEGYACTRPGVACVELPECGNGIRERGEQCDDGESPPEDGDGCSATCQQHPGYFCVPGQACKVLQCGNGVRTPDEACDDGGVDPGDGCSATCTVETGFRCGASGCRAICGDGLLKDDEECDDSNRSSGDGCSSACLEEPYYDCHGIAGPCDSTVVCGDGSVGPGEICDDGPTGTGDCIDSGASACKAFVVVGVDPPVCGDGTLQVGEACEDSDTSGGDGCSASCAVEAGWVCPKVNYCYKLPECGDGILQPGEGCDIGGYQTVSAACNDCQVQTNYYCSGEPSVCVSSICGDGVRAPNEACDNGPGTPASPGIPVDGDGCSATCTVEAGWACPPNGPCQPSCRDAVINGSEECESTTVGGALPTGCVNCKIAATYDCGASGKTCVKTTCGNGTKERGEGCDDGNLIGGDGCGPSCQSEPTVTPAPTAGTYPVVNVDCGDGLKTGTEECDDGNKTSGDGCTSGCLKESGWTCTDQVPDLATVSLKVNYRDFKYRTQTGGHPHFRTPGASGTTYPTGSDLGIAGVTCNSGNEPSNSTTPCGRLDSSGKPQLGSGTHSTLYGPSDTAEAFKLWYRDTNASHLIGASGEIEMSPIGNTDKLVLTRDATNTSKYVYDSFGNNFYPIDGRGFGNTPTSDGNNLVHNWHFTSELRYFFKYARGQELQFYGDDDVWVFVNGRLAVDIGGIHGQLNGRVILGDEDTSCSFTGTGACTLSAGELTDTNDSRFNIDVGKVYEIVIFQAERNLTGSNYKLTLDGFLSPRSFCSTTCGDGIRAGTELCDEGDAPPSSPNDGVYNVNGQYGKCNTSCTLTFCGDGAKQSSNEACDDGKNGDVWTTNGTGCAPGCVLPAKCGDGIVQSAFEVCDDGVNDGSYGGCKAGCQALGGYCGDNTKNGTEDCDTGPNRVAYASGAGQCGFDCKPAPYCGDGVRNGAEQCDGGAGCTSSCTIVGYCGDGVTGGTEECDYGSYNSSTPPYGGCDTSCQDGPGCGDDTTLGQEDYEECDFGVDNQDGVYGGCSTSCVYGPRCGDGEIQVGLEVCDNGFNEDTYAYAVGVCGPNCTAVPYCGDGLVQPDFELCDNGVQNASGAYNGCDTSCSWGPYCGDDEINGTEECDDGTQNVSYSATGTGCGYDCKKPPFCGDGVRNGPEQCDLGTASNNGEYGACNANCTLAPRCGDKKVDKDQGEECDAGTTGSLSCSPLCKSRKIVK